MVCYVLLLFELKLEITTRGTNSIPFLIFRRDHLRSTSGIICNSGSFAVQFGDHFRSGDHLRSGIICGAAQYICSEMRSDSKWCFAFVVNEFSRLRHTIVKKYSNHGYGCSKNFPESQKIMNNQYLQYLLKRSLKAPENTSAFWSTVGNVKRFFTMLTFWFCTNYKVFCDSWARFFKNYIPGIPMHPGILPVFPPKFPFEPAEMSM